MSELQQDDHILVEGKEKAQNQQVLSFSHQASPSARRRGSALRRFFSKVRGVAGRLWPHVRPVVGIPLIYIGVVLMVVFYFTNLTNKIYSELAHLLTKLDKRITIIQKENEEEKERQKEEVERKMRIEKRE